MPVNGHNATGDHLLQVAITGASTNLTVQLPLIAPRAGIVYTIVCTIYRVINMGENFHESRKLGPNVFFHFH